MCLFLAFHWLVSSNIDFLKQRDVRSEVRSDVRLSFRSFRRSSVDWVIRAIQEREASTRPNVGSLNIPYLIPCARYEAFLNYPCPLQKWMARCENRAQNQTVSICPSTSIAHWFETSGLVSTKGNKSRYRKLLRRLARNSTSWVQCHWFIVCFCWLSSSFTALSSVNCVTSWKTATMKAIVLLSWAKDLQAL